MRTAVSPPIFYTPAYWPYLTIGLIRAATAHAVATVSGGAPFAFESMSGATDTAAAMTTMSASAAEQTRAHVALAQRAIAASSSSSFYR